MEATLEDLKYPMGRFDWSRPVTTEDCEKAIQTIAAFPPKMREAIKSLNDTQLDTPYRPEGWTVRQVVHHCADSHTNAYIRFKLALTEDTPVIKPYLQAEWAKLPDSKLDPGISLAMIDGVHRRWVTIMENMSEADWELGWIHPEHNNRQGLKQIAVMYGWHCEHHRGHITRLRERMGW
jgi:hypothetical protein